MLRFVDGDLFDYDASIRINTVNCVGVMGKGIALAFKQRYPEMFEVYKKACDDGEVQPGRLHIWKSDEGTTVVNFPTKRHWRENSRYEDVEDGLKALHELLMDQGNVRVALPALGCGHGGLDWNRVSGMIEQYLSDVAAEVLVFGPTTSRNAGKDSPSLDERTKLDLEAANIKIVERFADTDLAVIGSIGVERLFVSGKAELLNAPLVSVLCSTAPSQREIDAATACVSKLADSSVCILVGFGAKIERLLIKTALDRGGSVVVSLPSGILDFRVPADLHRVWDSERTAVVSAALPHDHWTLKRLEASQKLGLALSKSVLITDINPIKYKALVSGAKKKHKLQVSFIDYQLDDAQLRALQPLKATAVRRCKRENTPNIEHIVKSLGVGQLGSHLTETKLEVAQKTDMESQVKEAWEDFVGSHPNSLKYPKRLIEVDLPISRISAHARREKSIRHGHISTLHIWWARRPLAACRAVICASLWPDPADPLCPIAFRDAAVKQIKEFAVRAASSSLPPELRPKLNEEQAELERGLSPECRARWEAIASGALSLDASEPVDMGILRLCLLDFIADFSNWDNSKVRAYLETSRALTKVAHESLGGIPGTRPIIIDPFAGGGAIPLEAARIGASAFATDLNPIAVLLNKVVLQYLPRYGDRLADDAKKCVDWVLDKSRSDLEKYYPADLDGGVPISYLWARTILSSAPGESELPVEVPLIRSFWLCKKSTRRLALKWSRDNTGRVRTEEVVVQLGDGRCIRVRRPQLEIFVPSGESDLDKPTVARGSVTCPVTSFTTGVNEVRDQLCTRKGGAADARLLAIAKTAVGFSGREYRLPNERDFELLDMARNDVSREEFRDFIPSEEISINELRRISVPIYGMKYWSDLFTPRQLLSMAILARNIRLSASAVLDSADNGYIEATSAVVSLTLGKQADLSNSLCAWEPIAECPRHLFGRQAIGIVWDFAEGVITGSSSGSYEIQAERLEHILKTIGYDWIEGDVEMSSATAHPLPDDSVQCLVTDPPYYDAVPYAHLSDFFYVWIRKALSKTHAKLMESPVVPKAQEIVVDRPHRLSDSKKDITFYENELRKAFLDARRVVQPQGIGTIVFASKTTSSWEAILNAIVEAGWTISASWPIDTEMGSRVAAQGQARLASSIHIVCRPREDSDGTALVRTGEWRDVLAALPKRIHEWMPRLTAEGVVGADAIFACLGPALEIFSKYSRVEKSNGDLATLREYLEFVWASVSTEALALIFKDADASGLEPDARLTAMWLWTLGGTAEESRGVLDSDSEDLELLEDEDVSATKAKPSGGYSLEFDAARKIAQGLGIHLEQCTSLVEIIGDQARLLPVGARTGHLFGADASRAAGRGTGKLKQKTLFDELDEAEAAEAGWTDLKGPPPGSTTLDRVHQAMILFAANRGELLKRFLVDDGVGKESRFWKLADNLNKLYPAGSEERRWVEGVLARKRGLGL